MKKAVFIYILLVVLFFTSLQIVVSNNKKYEDEKKATYQKFLATEINEVINSNGYAIVDTENEIVIFDNENIKERILKTDMGILNKKHTYTYLDKLYYLVVSEVKGIHQYSYYDIYTLDLVKEIKIEGERGK